MMYKQEDGGAWGDGPSVSSHEIDLREVFGPLDWDKSEVREWDAPWPKHVTIELDDPTHPKNWHPAYAYKGYENA